MNTRLDVQVNKDQKAASATEPPVVSVLLPIFNSVTYLRLAIDSIINQTFTNWELLALNEARSDDGSAEIVQLYAKDDPRIRLIQNDTQLGLAESLNLGLRLAKGRYVARMDADDISHPSRFQKQVDFLDRHPRVGICGAFQRYFQGSKTIWIHEPSTSSKGCKARLLWWCDVCHSTLMLRKKNFIDNGLFYDSSFAAEDYELWTRALMVTEFANLPEVLGDYRKEGQNITNEKRTFLVKEHGRIVAATLRRTLGLHLEPLEIRVLDKLDWPAGFAKSLDQDLSYGEALLSLKGLIIKIWHVNKKKRFFDPLSLLDVSQRLWDWATIHRGRHDPRIPKFTLEAIFEPDHQSTLREQWSFFLAHYKTPEERCTVLKRRIVAAIKKIGLWLTTPIRMLIEYELIKAEKRIDRRVEVWTWDRFKRTDKKIEEWTWDRFKRTEAKLAAPQTSSYVIKYCPGTKIRLAILFQMPSMWPAIEGVWSLLSHDDRFDVKLILYDGPAKDVSQAAGASDFLNESGLPYETLDTFNLAAFKPHIFLYQTPWDDAHRPGHLQSDFVSQCGSRPAYIPYGIEYSAHGRINYVFSNLNFKARPWRIYSLSERMKYDHFKNSPQGAANIMATGLPRFDNLISSCQKPALDSELKERVNGRQIVLFSLHFPETVHGQQPPIPDIAEYLDFFEDLADYQHLFFMIRPHPKFFSIYEKLGRDTETKRMGELVACADNAHLDLAHDYRPALMNVDFMVADRTALLFEGAALGLPIVYMTNLYQQEPLLPSIEPLFESFYTGNTSYDIKRFLDLVVERGIDYKKGEREAAINTCLPYLDGRCAARIVEDLAQSLLDES